MRLGWKLRKKFLDQSAQALAIGASFRLGLSGLHHHPHLGFANTIQSSQRGSDFGNRL